MNVEKNEKKALSLAVTDGLTVTIFPNSDHEFLINTKEVAKGYGSTEYAIRQSKSTNQSEFIEGKHFVRGVSISHTQPHQVFWTKRGVVRLGFFIKSKQAKLFRDWAEDLVLDKIESAPLKQPKSNDPVEQLMEMALEAGEVEIRRQLFQCYQSLKAYTEDMKNEIDILRVNNDKWCSFIAKKTKSYQSQKGGQA